MQRRRFLFYFLSALAAYAPSPGCRNKDVLSNSTLQLPRLLSRLTDEETVRQIGKTYRNQVKVEDGQDKLTRLLLQETSVKTLFPTSDAAFVSKFLEEKIQQDFESGRLIVLQGWILSLTEARQCALYSIFSS